MDRKQLYESGIFQDEQQMNRYWREIFNQYGVYDYWAEWVDSIKGKRESYLETSDYKTAILNSFSFDKQSMLEKHWKNLSIEEKMYYLKHVWLEKKCGIVFGLDWWLPYFEEIRNFQLNKMEGYPITLYRGAENQFKCGMSWTDSKEIAKDFSEQYFDSKLFKVEVTSTDILAIYDIYSIPYKSVQIITGDTEELPKNIKDRLTNKDTIFAKEYVLNHRSIEKKIETVF
ncbi:MULTISPECIES: hypothetical protein [Enterococcus]|uniref:hypothetical protein n=1 Tax=Enterococcus TaxID=1350 RepID=UPI00249212F0|nr:hypothetical protein [Enterococcus dispar]